jgi:putative MATE family efflux protein
VFAVLITFICRPFFRIQTSNPEIVSAGITYMQIVGILSVGMFFQVMMEKLLQSTGKTNLSMITQIVGACINMIMDPILIFGLIGFPKLGIAGAAIATIFGQSVGGLLALYFNKTKNKELVISFKKYPLRLENVKRIYEIGLPSIIMQSIGSIMTFGFNKILINFSSTATAVFGVYFKLQSFVLLPIIGLNNGMMPIIAYNFGARKPDRIKQTLKYSYLAAYVMILVGFGLFVAVPEKMLLLFSASDDMLAIGVPALRIISLHFLLAAFSIVSSSFFQAMGHGFISMINAISRQLLVLLPVAYILSKIGGLTAVWWAFPIAELVAVALAAIFMIKVYTEEVKPLYSEI